MAGSVRSNMRLVPGSRGRSLLPLPEIFLHGDGETGSRRREPGWYLVVAVGVFRAAGPTDRIVETDLRRGEYGVPCGGGVGLMTLI
jgi:hypothetical protein